MGPNLSIEWSSKQQNDVYGFAFSDFEGKMTASLDIRGTQSTKLKDVVGTFGFPSDVVAHDCWDSSCFTQLIYLSSGMMLDVYPAPDRRGFVKISPDTEVEEIWFFPPEQDGYITAFPQYSEGSSIWAVPWEGYTKYKVAIW